MALKWKKIDVAQTQIPFIEKEDEIYIAREYISGRNYLASSTNQLISNFKKEVSRKGKLEWKYKEEAIKQFAEELSLLFKDDTEYVLAAIPSSICRDDPQYDSRVDNTLLQLKRIKDRVIIEEPIIRVKTTTPSHLGGTRDPDILYKYMHWRGLRNKTNQIILVDDVITIGAHFAACKRMIKENHPQMKVIGVFWAKTIWDKNIP